MKKVIIFLLVFFAFESKAQLVTLTNNQFKLEGENFYPMVLNYGTNLVSDNGNFYLSPEHAYNVSLCNECNDMVSCQDQMQTDFNYITTMGFNTVRITGFAIKYIAGQGLITSYTNANCSSIPVNLPINPLDPLDPGMNRIFSFYDKILEVAANTTSHPLKVIFLSNLTSSTLNTDEVNAMNGYYQALAFHLSSCANNDQFLAYDLINEPCIHINNKTKIEACEIVANWYDIIKENDSEHLITIGSCGLSDVFSFDPAILKLDFLSLHFYPSFKPYEDKNLSSIQELGRKRIANDLFWMQNATPLPWIIGETGFTSSPNYGVSEGLDGTIGDAVDFTSFTLDANCNCGGIGYSWWWYQDVDFAAFGSSLFGLNYFGLLNMNTTPSVSSEKQDIVDVFRNYTPETNKPCPVDYSPQYDANKLYYNANGYPPNPGYEISSIVKNQDGFPIKNAVIRVNVDMGSQLEYNSITQTWQPVSYYDGFYTYTDENGFFKAIPNQYGLNTPYPPFPGIAQITISAPGAEVLTWGWCAGCLAIPSEIILEQIDYDVVYNNEIVQDDYFRDYKGTRSVSVLNVNINPGGGADIHASREVEILPGVEFSASSDVEVFISPYISPCDEK